MDPKVKALIIWIAQNVSDDNTVDANDLIRFIGVEWKIPNEDETRKLIKENRTQKPEPPKPEEKPEEPETTTDVPTVEN